MFQLYLKQNFYLEITKIKYSVPLLFSTIVGASRNFVITDNITQNIENNEYLEGWGIGFKTEISERFQMDLKWANPYISLIQIVNSKNSEGEIMKNRLYLSSEFKF